MIKKRITQLILILFAFTMILLSSQEALAASRLDLYYYGTKENVKYTGQQVKYYLDGQPMNMKKTPGIIINGTSLVSYKDIFVNSDINLDYIYNKSKSTVTVSNDVKKIVFTIGSKKAYVNGKAVTLSVAPIKVLFKAQNVTKILVPARFVAESFGYSYTWNSTASTASIKSPLNLYYNGKKVPYTGTLGQVVIDGSKINVAPMPSIIINNTAMVRAKKVFSSSSIGAGYNYNSTKKELTLTKGNIVVKLTLGSSIAYVNGKPRIMDTAPLAVKNLDYNYSYIMVPGSFVASYLGYDYNWNSASKSSIITTRIEDDNSGDVADGPELGGDDTLPDTTFFQWDIDAAYLNDYTNVNNMNNTAEISFDKASTSYMTTITNNYVAENNKEIYAISSTSPISKVTSSLTSNSLNLHVNNFISNNNTFNFSGNIVDTIATTYDVNTTSSNINFHLLNADVKYELTLSEDNCTLYVTVYKNYLSKVIAGSTGNSEFVQLTGMKPLNVQLVENSNLILLTVSNTMNGIGYKYADNLGGGIIKSVQTTNIDNSTTQIAIYLNNTSKYFINEANNTYTISFGDSNVGNAYSDLQIKLPTGVNFSQVTNEDRYYNNEFAIILPGDQRSFYAQSSLSSNNNVVKNISVSYRNQNTEIIVQTTKIQGYKLAENNGFIDVTIGDPRDIYKNIVVLDAGHGGTDPGAVRSLNGKQINEKDINFKIMYTLTQKYFNSENSNIKVYYSRYNDTKVDLYERAAFADEVGADMFISLHMNANTDTSIKGTEIYYSNSNNSLTDNGLTSKGLASLFLNYLPNAIGTRARSIRAEDYVVVRENTVPAVLIELAFISNVDELSLMTDSTFQDNSAKAIYDTLNIIFNAYPTGR